MPTPEVKPTIAVDIDDVLVPHAEELIDWYNREYGTELTLAHNHTRDVKVLGTKNLEEAIKRVHKYIQTGDLFKAQPVKESFGALRKLSQHYNLIIITGRDSFIEQNTREWINSHYPQLFKEVHFTAVYNLEGKTTTKADVCLQTNASYLIDDSLEEILKAAKVGITALLFGDAPWNQASELPKNVVRARNWQEVLEYFNEQG